MGDVVNLETITTGEVPPDKVLNGALDVGMKYVLVVGYDKNDNIYIASSDGNVGELLILLEIARALILEPLVTPQGAMH